MGLPKNVVPITLSLPKTLRHQMAEVEGVNWSAVAARAFQKVLKLRPENDRVRAVRLAEECRQLRAKLARIRKMLDS